MKYKVIAPNGVLKELSKFEKKVQQFIFDKIVDLENGYFYGDKTLKGKYKGKFRKQAGDYRIIYDKEDDILVISVARIAHRKEIY
jgi:mRNA interferase RelE/StbE